MPSTSYFFPRRLQGTALGIQAGIGNFGVSLVQLLTPALIGISSIAIGVAGGQQLASGKVGVPAEQVWYQNFAFVYIPFAIVGAILAWTMLKSVPVKSNIKQQFDIFRNQDTWWMTILYIMTFGTFSGLGAVFGNLITTVYGKANPDIWDKTLGTELPNGTMSGGVIEQLQGYEVPDPLKLALYGIFLGPLIGAAARVLFSPLTDKTGGAIWTVISGVGLVVTIGYTVTTLSPDITATTNADDLTGQFHNFYWGMLAINFFAGMGNASTFKQMPMIFERRQAGGVIGWTAAIAAFGPFGFSFGLIYIDYQVFFAILAAFALLGTVIAWMRYARPGAPKKS
jgi:NNP family nitrate/nitrite transporter-like MFS transporter